MDRAVSLNGQVVNRSRIMLVDDEECIRESISSLCRRGQKIFGASGTVCVW